MNLRLSFLTLLVGVGAVACTGNKTGEQYPEGVATYVNFTISLPGVKTRDLPEDYNPDGTYGGLDFVQSLDIYMLAGDGTIEAKRFTGNDISSDGQYVAPSQPFRTTSGYKTVYIVLNDPNALETTITSETTLVPVTDLARTTTVNGTLYDMITMTGKSDRVYINPDVPIQDVSGGANTIEVTVDRVASKVIVTTNASPELYDENNVLLGTVSNVTWSVAQGTNEIYWIAQPDYVSYGYDYVPELGEYYNGDAVTYYDYSDLSTPTAVSALPTASDGYKSLQGKFVFENTHEYGNSRTTTDYRKGNTAYVLVRAVFTPAASAIADGEPLPTGHSM